jgi:ABC-type transport system involved in multi-copper enzyme maturation permease subunit
VIRAFASEWIKLRRRSILVGGLSMTVLAGAGVAFGIIRVATSQRRDAVLELLVLRSGDGLVAALIRVSDFIVVIPLVIVAAAVAGEYAQGTMRNLLVREPGRIRLLLGKFAALLVYCLIASTVAFGVGALIAFQVAPHEGINTAPWTTPDALHNLLSLWGNLLLSTTAWCVLGLLGATVFRSPAAAVGVSLVFLLVVENLVIAIWTEAPQWLFVTLNQAIIAGGNTNSDYGRAVGLIGLYCACAVVVAAVVFRRRDVSA